MQKIPTLFQRGDDGKVINEVTPGCDWVQAGEGVATRKYDGTCILIRRDGLMVHAYAEIQVAQTCLRELARQWVKYEERMALRAARHD